MTGITLTLPDILRSNIARLLHARTYIYIFSGFALATISKCLQPSPNVSNHLQRDSDLAITDSVPLVPCVPFALTFCSVRPFGPVGSYESVPSLSLCLKRR